MVIIRKKHKESAEEKEAKRKIEEEQAMGIQDQYQARGFELVSWVQDNKGLVTVIIAVLIVAGALWSAYLYYQKRSAEMASSAFLEAVKPVEDIEKTGQENQEKWDVARAKLEEVAKDYKGTGASFFADLYAGHLALEGRDAKRAIELYQKAINGLKKSNPLHPFAVIGLGYAQEMDGDQKNAFLTFQSLTEAQGSIGKDLALWESARIAHDLKDDESAKKNIERLLKEYPASIYEKSALRLKESLSSMQQG